MLKKEIIQRVLDKASILDVVSDVCAVKKKGGRYWACCPFHDEKTPSFSINVATNTWYCFGACGEGGGVVNFVMKYYNLTFIEAIEKLAEKYGIRIEKTDRELSLPKPSRGKRCMKNCSTSTMRRSSFLSILSNPTAPKPKRREIMPSGDGASSSASRPESDSPMPDGKVSQVSPTSADSTCRSLHLSDCRASRRKTDNIMTSSERESPSRFETDSGR